MNTAPPTLSVLIATHNRAADLAALLQSVVDQELRGASFEVVVVDNNSTADTRAVVERFVAAAPERVRYLFEPRQGKPYALNLGIQAVRGELCHIVDDDQSMPPGYLQALVAAFERYPRAAFIGGKVLPRWEAEPPAWLTPQHWSPLGMCDYGEEPFTVDRSREICLITCAFRTSVLREISGFDPRMTRSQDAEIQKRLIRRGFLGQYVPGLVLGHKAPRERLTLAYYRYWYERNGRYAAIERDEAIERSRARLFDVPAHLYRSALSELIGWGRSRLLGRQNEALLHLERVLYHRGFMRQRISDYLRSGERHIPQRSTHRERDNRGA